MPGIFRLTVCDLVVPIIPDAFLTLIQVAMVSRITLNLRKQALGTNIVVIPSEWKLPRTVRWRSGSNGTAKPLYPEHIPLSPTYSVLNLTPEAGVTRVLANPAGEKARFQLPGV